MYILAKTANNNIAKITNLDNQVELIYLSLAKNQIEEIEDIDNLDKL